MVNAKHKASIAALAGVVAAIGSTLCCAGPLVAVAVGMSSAGIAPLFEPLRPFFILAAVAAIGSGFVVLHREERKACHAGAVCASPLARRRMKQVLWVATAIAIPLLTFPYWSALIL
jgi:mercuric ion transport protein